MRFRLILFAKLIITLIAAFVIANAVTAISSRINFLERFSIAVTDIDFTDLYYQYKPAAKPDSNIVIVNIGYANRSELANALKIISESKPKVIGVDIFFDQLADSLNPEGTQQLVSAFKEIKNAVLASSYYGKDENGNDLVAGQSPLIKKHVIESLVNLNVSADDPEMGTVRSYNPITNINGVPEIFFGLKLASFGDDQLLLKPNETENFIRWYGYANRRSAPDSLKIFKAIEWDSILTRSFSREEIQNKIILFGFLGKTINDSYSADEKLYSPLNGKMVGRSLPDIYGVEVHANIVKMILDNDYIYHSWFMDFIINLFVILIMTVILFWIQKKFERQYSILSKIALIVFVDLLLAIALELFFQTDGSFKIVIGNGLFIMLFLPDSYEFLESNLFKIFK